MFGLLVGFILLFAMVVVVANSFFSYRVYLSNKQEELNRLATTLEAIVGDSASLSNYQLSAIEALNEQYPYNFILRNTEEFVYPSSYRNAGMHFRFMARQFDNIFNNPIGKSYFSVLADQYVGLVIITLNRKISHSMILVINSPIYKESDLIYVYNRLLFNITLIVLCLAIGAAIFFARGSTGRFLLLNDAVQRLAKLQFDKPLKVNGNDEISDLANHINWLSTQLEQAINLLNQQNKGLESKLSQTEERQAEQQAFVAMLSHELKSPLFILQGYNELLLTDLNEDDDKKQYALQMEKEIDKMSNLVSDMLGYSGLFAVQENLNSPYSLSALLAKIVKLYSPLALKKEVTFAFNTEKEVEVIGQTTHGELIVRNYLSNALAYAKEKSVINIRILEEEDGIKLEVENAGDHIIMDNSALLWQPFYKGDKSRNRMLGGTGLGLALVAKVLGNNEERYGFYNSEHNNHRGVVFWCKL